jgi:hypothetical protein
LIGELIGDLSGDLAGDLARDWPIPAAGDCLRKRRAPISAKIEMMNIIGLFPSRQSGCRIG